MFTRLIMMLSLAMPSPPKNVALLRDDGTCIAHRRESAGRSGGHWQLCDNSTWDEAMDTLISGGGKVTPE